MIKILLLMLIGYIVAILLFPSRYIKYIWYYAWSGATMFTAYTLVFIREFDVYSEKYQLVQKIQFFVGLNGITILAIITVSILFFGVLISHREEIQNKTYLLAFFSAEFTLILILLTWYN